MLYFYMFIIVQIVLESFPVSSSGHLIVLERVARSCGYAINYHAAFFFQTIHAHLVCIAVFEHALHGVTAFLLLLFFGRSWRAHMRRMSWWALARVLGLVVLADMVTVLFFVFFSTRGVTIKTALPVGVGFLLTAIALFSVRYAPEGSSKWRTSVALAVGAAQGVALVPGVSRFAFTYVTARWLCLSERRAFACSFGVQLPLIIGAFVHAVYVCAFQMPLCVLCGWSTAFVVCAAAGFAWLGLRFSYWCALTERMWWFSWYLMVPIIVWLVYG